MILPLDGSEGDAEGRETHLGRYVDSLYVSPCLLENVLESAHRIPWLSTVTKDPWRILSPAGQCPWSY